MDLNQLNLNQRKTVLKTDGPIMILAGAGSGKTRTLVAKVGHLLKEKKIGPYQILALTFSNKAAREMRERVASEVNIRGEVLQITTFHSFCSKILRTEANYLGLSRNFTIYGTSESKSIVKALLGRRGINPKELSPFDVLNYIEELKNNGHYLGKEISEEDDIHKEDDFYSYFCEYEEELRKANALDFGGLITAVLQLFEQHKNLLDNYQERYHYILVDEYQDTNRAQFELIKLLSEKRRNICVVGDEDQSIYSWRGADIRNILDFEKYFPEVEVLKLEQNYRSSKNIIEAASCVIARNTMRKGKEMWTENPEGDSIEILECGDEKREAEFISQKILELSSNKKEKIPLFEMAVFYRTNAQSRIIEDALRKERIPYRIVGGTKFYDRKEIKDLLSYLRLIINPKDSLAFGRIVNVPARGIGATTLRKLEQEAISQNISLYELVERLVDSYEEYSHLKLSGKIRSHLSEFANLISEARLMESRQTLPNEIYEKILNESGYLDSLKLNKDYESQARMENLEELSSAFKQYQTSNQNPSLLGFLEMVTLDTTVAEVDDESHLNADHTGEVSLMTVHGAKGLEFTHVFLAGAEENIFPSYKSLEDGDRSIEEERRLFYVAMTRAMKKLYICFARARMLFGQIRFNGPSRFLMEFPNKYYSWNYYKTTEEADYADDSNDYESQENPYLDDDVVYEIRSTPPKKEIQKPKYPQGSKVLHSLFGEGKIIQNEGLGSEEKVVIQFKTGEKKKFMVKFAPLSLL